MALLKIAEDKNEPGQIRIYETKQDVEIAVHYVLRDSRRAVCSNIGLFSSECVAAQINYVQRCRVKAMSNRLIHYVLAFDSYGIEREIGIGIAWSIMNLINITFFPEYQKIICMHTDTPSHLHMHILINPVNLADYSLLRCNFEAFKKELAVWLGEVYQIALVSETFLDVNDKLRWGKDEVLYQKKYCEEHGFKKEWFLV